jgi:hypothetical protein
MRGVKTWPPWNVTGLHSKLDELPTIVENSKGMDPDGLAWMSRMLVIRSSGFLEQTANEVCFFHVESRSGGIVRSFAQSWLERSRNPSPENLSDLVGRFGGSLQSELLELLDKNDQRIRRGLAYLVDRRNRIAHGLNESVSRDKSLDLKKVAIEVSDWLILRFNPL